MSLSETDTSDNCLYCCLAVPLSGFGNVRVMPFCPPIPPLPLINCFTISLLLYKRQFLSTQAYWMWQTCLLRPICLSVLLQGQGTFVMLTGVPDLSVAQLSLLAWYTLLSTSKLYCFAPRLCEALHGLSSYRHPWLMATRCKADSMPKYRRERIVCPCYKLSRLKLWWLASRSANTLALCRYSRPANTSLPTLTVSIFLLTSLYITHHSSCSQYQ